MTTYTADSVVVGVDPDMTADQFAQVLSDAGSPAAAEAHGAYVALTSYRVSPRYCLAVFHHESRYGTDPQSVNLRYGTKNPGNNRSLRAKIPNASVIQTDRGAFVQYETWTDGFTDMAARLVDPSYVYAQRGLKTPAQIIPTSAPASDGNDPTAYITDVVTMMNDYPQGQAGGTTVGRDPKAIWKGSNNYNKGRSDGTTTYFVDHITDHMTAGTNSVSWLMGTLASSNTGSSAHYLVSRDGTIYQFVDENDTAWIDGNLLYNYTAIGIEHESLEGQGFTDAQITASIGLQARIAQRQKWTSVHHPTDAVLPAGGPPGTASLIGHSQVPDPNNPALGGGIDHHTGCPGPLYPWQRVVDGVNAILNGSLAPQDAPGTTPADDGVRYFPETQHTLRLGFRAFYESHPDALALFGFPISEEFQQNGLTVQYFERARFEWHPGSGLPFDVQLGLLGDESIAAVKAANPAAFKPVPQPA